MHIVFVCCIIITWSKKLNPSFLNDHRFCSGSRFRRDDRSKWAKPLALFLAWKVKQIRNGASCIHRSDELRLFDELGASLCDAEGWECVAQQQIEMHQHLQLPLLPLEASVAQKKKLHFMWSVISFLYYSCARIWVYSCDWKVKQGLILARFVFLNHTEEALFSPASKWEVINLPPADKSPYYTSRLIHA